MKKNKNYNIYFVLFYFILSEPIEKTIASPDRIDSRAVNSHLRVPARYLKICSYDRLLVKHADRPETNKKFNWT